MSLQVHLQMPKSTMGPPSPAPRTAQRTTRSVSSVSPFQHTSDVRTYGPPTTKANTVPSVGMRCTSIRYLDSVANFRAREAFGHESYAEVMMIVCGERFENRL